MTELLIDSVGLGWIRSESAAFSDEFFNAFGGVVVVTEVLDVALSADVEVLDVVADDFVEVVAEFVVEEVVGTVVLVEIRTFSLVFFPDVTRVMSGSDNKPTFVVSLLSIFAASTEKFAGI
jgi:uncharacterized protein YhfF